MAAGKRKATKRPTSRQKRAPPAVEPTAAHAPVAETVTLSPAEHVALEIAARARGVAIPELLRTAALAAIRYRGG